MKVLVGFASRHGATSQIAESIGDVLSARGHDVIVRPTEEVSSVGGFDAVVLGSAIYMGHWLAPARKWVDRHGDELAARPVWLFSSGPIGDPPKPDPDSIDVEHIVAVTHARDHRVFGGELDKGKLSFKEKLAVGAVKAPEGDYRDWDEIRKWANGVADTLPSGRT